MSVSKLGYEKHWDIPDWRVRDCYAVFEHKLVLDGTSTYARSFIVLKNQYDVSVHFMSTHNYMDASYPVIYQ